MQTTHPPGNVEDQPSEIPAQPSAPAAWMRPSGLGTSAALTPEPRMDACTGLRPPTGRISRLPSIARWSDTAAYAERPWGDGSAPPLYCPRTERIDDALAEEVENRLGAWAAGCGCSAEELEALRKASFGRLVMLAHGDIDDPDALLVAAQMNTAWWAADDYYADSTEAGADPSLLPPRLVLAMEAMDPAPAAGELAGPLDEALRGDLVLRMLRSAVEHLARHGSSAQVQRACYSTFAMFVSWNAYAAWREAGEFPPAWEYLTARQHDSFYTSMVLIDPVGAYEVPAALFYEPRVRRAAFLAGTASVLVNDLFSVAKDAADEKPVCNVVALIAADRGCSVQEATEATVALHNDFVHEFEAVHHELAAVPSPELQRFLHGLRAWMGGGFEWHATNPRYQQPPQQPS
jgi:2-methylisoborneol synthase